MTTERAEITEHSSGVLALELVHLVMLALLEITPTIPSIG
jgi:hypothetical protein